MRKTFSLFVALIAAVGCAAQGGTMSSVDKASLAESHYKMGVAFLSSDSDHQAYTELKSALEIEPENDKYLYMMGLFYVKKERYQEAEPYIKKALDQKPGYSEYMNAYATVLAGTGRIDQAIGYWDKVIADPGYPYHIIALYNAGNALYEAGRFSSVPSYINRALDINRRYTDAYKLLFNSYIKAGNKAKAEETMLKAAQMVPEEPYFQLVAAEYYFDQKAYAKAVPFLERLVDNFPDTPQGKRAEDLMKKLGLINE